VLVLVASFSDPSTVPDGIYYVYILLKQYADSDQIAELKVTRNEMISFFAGALQCCLVRDWDRGW
jgi:hypothetical protein